jgi:hypothetical protein
VWALGVPVRVHTLAGEDLAAAEALQAAVDAEIKSLKALVIVEKAGRSKGSRAGSAADTDAAADDESASQGGGGGKSKGKGGKGKLASSRSESGDDEWRDAAVALEEIVADEGLDDMPMTRKDKRALRLAKKKAKASAAEGGGADDA